MSRSNFHQPCVSFVPSRPLLWFRWVTDVFEMKQHCFVVIFLYKRIDHLSVDLRKLF
ncbi:hypothetical protein AtNW77_Chr2g0261291 [Arabidopsis thaliana]|uniref:Uncharacterized protein n=1 Tax=Arabidopsis thaliana TaxID=3702 RepID=A0A178VVF0_ARATH|nr:hypothetical protein AXX17_AT2G36590 [Arabidopsis thaliana]